MSDKVKLVFKKEIGLISWPCTISVPKDDGKREEQILTARFKIVPQARMDEISAAAASSRTPVNPEHLVLNEALDGFDGLKDESGQPVPDAVAKTSLLSIPYVADGVGRGYFEMLGRRTAKN